MKVVAVALFPRISILNHSCNPNIRNVFDGNQLTIHATRSIIQNEEIYNCYCPNFKLMKTIDRKAVLESQYGFDCNCSICSNSSADEYTVIFQISIHVNCFYNLFP